MANGARLATGDAGGRIDGVREGAGAGVPPEVPPERRPMVGVPESSSGSGLGSRMGGGGGTFSSVAAVCNVGDKLLPLPFSRRYISSLCPSRSDMIASSSGPMYIGYPNWVAAAPAAGAMPALSETVSSSGLLRCGPWAGLVWRSSVPAAARPAVPGDLPRGALGPVGYGRPRVATGVPRSLPRSPYVAGRLRGACLRMDASAATHSRWACPRPAHAR